MLDPTTLPILLKSLEFLYDEYSKLLTERRERRKEERDAAKEKVEQEEQVASLPAPTKEVAVTQKVDPARWQNNETQIEHLNQLLDIHYGNYRHLSKQHAEWGALVPPIIVNSLKREEEQIEKLTAQLQETLSKVYGKEA